MLIQDGSIESGVPEGGLGNASNARQGGVDTRQLHVGAER